MLNQSRNLLKEVFGYQDWRPLQKEIISSVLQRIDTLVVLPTGGGKSICYQIPALMYPNLTLVISPLISLMHDQVEQLRKAGVPAVYLNSSLSYPEFQKNKNLILQRKVKMLYLAPESVFRADIIAMLHSVTVDCIAIDEAHCISAWGHDFRPEYRNLTALRREFPKAAIIALTATATHKVREDIKISLNFTRDYQEFIGSFDRKNLFLDIKTKQKSYEQVKEVINRYKDQSGIIYCFSRKQVESLTEKLKEDGVRALPYHAGLTDDERIANQNAFVRDDTDVIVATIAFGMGINKPDVRFVIHYDLPKNLESYYQEIGRAGRDGLPSYCLLLFSHGDINKVRYFIDRIENPFFKRSSLEHLRDMVRYAESVSCRRGPLLHYFGEKYHSENCSACDNCVRQDAVLEDISREARAFLRCIEETGERFGAEHIINILRGAKTKKVLDYNHERLKSYGAGALLDKASWVFLKDEFLKEGLIEKDEEKYGALVMTPDGKDVLRERRSVSGKMPEKGAPEPVKSVKSPVPGNYDAALFQILRQKRKELADLEGVPPYVIFHDSSLIQMASQKPVNIEAFAAITGVGQKKLEKFGHVFINIILANAAR